MKDQTKAIIFLVLATLAFSSMELAGKFVVQLSSMQVTFFRFSIGSLVLIPFAWLDAKRRKVKITLEDWAWMAILGVCNIVIAMVLLQKAVTMIPASLAAVIISSNPIFVVIFAALILKEKISGKTVVGLVFGVFGLTIVTDIFSSVSNIDQTGLLSAIGAALFFGLYTVLSKRTIRRLGGMLTNFGSFTLGSMVLLVMMFFRGEPVLQGLDQTTILPILYLALVVTAGAYICFLKGLSYVDASKGAVIFFFKPIVASILAMVILHEVIGWNVVLGTLFVISGSALMVLKKKRPQVVKVTDGTHNNG